MRDFNLNKIILIFILGFTMTVPKNVFAPPPAIDPSLCRIGGIDCLKAFGADAGGLGVSGAGAGTGAGTGTGAATGGGIISGTAVCVGAVAAAAVVVTALGFITYYNSVSSQMQAANTALDCKICVASLENARQGIAACKTDFPPANPNCMTKEEANKIASCETARGNQFCSLIKAQATGAPCKNFTTKCPAFGPLPSC